MTRKNQFDPTEFDPEMIKADMATATNKRSRKPKAEPPPATSLPPDDDSAADKDRAEVNESVEQLKERLAATEKKLNSFSGWQKKLRDAMARVTTARAEFEKADAKRKEAKAAVDTAVAKVLEIDAKIANGEQLLPFPSTDDSAKDEPVVNTPLATPTTDYGGAMLIELLLVKNIKKVVGNEVFEDSKAKDQPIGLSDKQLEILVAAEIKTIGDLEKRISADAWFLKNLKGFGEKNIDRLTDTLLAFRGVYPVPLAAETPAPSQPEPEKPADPQPDEWEQSAYHLKELIAECNSLLESDINEDGKQFLRSVAMDAEEMLFDVTGKKSITADQKTAIENWTNGAAKWRKEPR